MNTLSQNPGRGFFNLREGKARRAVTATAALLGLLILTAETPTDCQKTSGWVRAVCHVTHYGGPDDHDINPYTANGDTFDYHAMTGASPDIPFGTMVTVTNQANNASVTVRVNDRGPAAWTGHCFDLTDGAFRRVAEPDIGVITASLKY